MTRSSNSRRLRSGRETLAAFTAAALLLGTPLSVRAQFSSGSTGENGPFPPADPPEGTTAIELNLQNGEVTFEPGGSVVVLPNTPEEGFTDGVLHFTSIALPAGITWTFSPAAGNPSIVALAQGDVEIAGTLQANGDAGGGFGVGGGGRGGPGGFAGGQGHPVGSTGAGGLGLGPGGGGAPGINDTTKGGGGAGFGAPGQDGFPTGTANAGGTYGTLLLRPLYGGSGGQGSPRSTNVQFNTPAVGTGGGGGGAICIASSTSINISGTIFAEGGLPGQAAGGGSGGAVLLMANTLTGSGAIRARGPAGGDAIQGLQRGGNGGLGRIRLEAIDLSFNGARSGIFSTGAPGPVPLPSALRIQVTSVGGEPVDPLPAGALGGVDVLIPTTGLTTVEFAAAGLPPGTTLDVVAKPAAVVGDFVGPVTSAGLAGTIESSTTSVQLEFPSVGTYFIEASAN